MRRILLLMLTLSMIMSLVACGSNETSDPTPPISYEAGDNMSSEDESESKSLPKIDTEAITIEEQVLFDEAGIKVTATDLESGLFGTEIKVLVENNTEDTKVVQAQYTVVNGYMIQNLFSAEVAAGKKSNDTITLYQNEMDASGIDTVADIEVSIIVINAEDWRTELESDPVQIKTSAFDGFIYKYNDAGQVLYEENGIRIITPGLVEDESIFGDGLLLYIENLSEKTITVQSNNLSVDGFMTEGILSQTVLPGKRAVTALTVMDYSLEENGITEITEMEFELDIFDNDSWKDIAKTDPINLKF